MSFTELTKEQKQRRNASQYRYRRAKTKIYSFRLYNSTDADLIDYLENIEGNRTEYIRRLIKEDMERNAGGTQNEVSRPIK